MSSKVFTDPNYESNLYIQKDTCVFRKALISAVNYKVTLALPKGDFYFGSYVLDFELSALPSKQLWIDHRGLKIANYKINGEAVTDEGIFSDHQIRFPTKMLKVGQNQVTIELWNKYRKDGVGLHSFIDPKDQEQYMYTQFEPENCHWLFPVFEQPDLKAALSMNCVVPHDWVVVSNDNIDPAKEGEHATISTSLEQIADSFGQKDAWTAIDKPHHFCFKTTPRISSYLYCIVVGPYDYIEHIEEGFPPMRIYARKTLMPIDGEEMFRVTRVGMMAYKDFFGREYPFGKYDQVFVPEHNYGAMENVGCVTYNEAYLFKGQTPTLAKRLNFANTNLHELAHMWFGNLVTMEWWNDLWLNESFATYMAYLIESKAEDISYFHETVWITYLRECFWGIQTDSMSSTHPITCEIASTDEAVSIFDGISYGKGSAWLKQVYNILGHETMRNGLHQYFKKFEWQNTTLPDFIGCLHDAHQASGDKSMGEDFSFNEWSETWLKTSGVNVLEPVLEYNDDFSVKSFGIKQTCDLRGQNRIRKMKLNAVFYDSDFKAHESKNIILSDKDAITNVNFEFKGPVKAIIINHDAHAYSKILFDQRTLDTFETDMNRISDATTRALIWRNVWNQVREAKFSSVQFFNMVLKSIQSETVEQIIVYVLSILNVVIKSYLPHQVREESARKLFELLFNWLQTDIPDVIKNPIMDLIFNFFSGQKQTDDVRAWLKAGAVMAGEKEISKINDSKKRQILKRLFASSLLTTEQKRAHLEEVQGDDKSDLAQNCKLTCEALIPTAENKAAVWKEITDPTSTFSSKEREAKMSGFYASSQLDLVRPYFDQYYAILPEIETQHGFKYLESFTGYMVPVLEIEDKHLVKLVNIKSKIPDTNKVFMNILQDQIELLLRVKNVREFAEAENK